MFFTYFAVKLNFEYNSKHRYNAGKGKNFLEQIYYTGLSKTQLDAFFTSCSDFTANNCMVFDTFLATVTSRLASTQATTISLKKYIEFTWRIA